MSMLEARNTYPAKIPQSVLRIVRHGSVIKAPKYFGASVNSTGSRPITRSASISSVTTMVPISAEIADADRPLTLRAVISGPNSRVKPITTAQDRETRQRDQGTQILRRQCELHRIQAHHSERVDLLRHNHGSDLRRVMG